MKSLFSKIEQERIKQIRKFGKQKKLTDLESLSIVAEEFGEIAQIVTKRNVKPVFQKDLKKFPKSHLKNEILQTITCLVAWYERI